MGKISIDNAFEKISSPKKENENPVEKTAFLTGIPLISFKELLRRIKVANVYRVIREQLVRFYLKRVAACKGKDLLIIWQPVYFVFIKIAIAVTLSYLLFSQYFYLSSWLSQGLAFFRLNEIYNFEFPKQPFFDSLAKGILLVIIGYYGLYFTYYQIQALFSSFVVSGRQKKAYYIKNFLVKKDLYIFSLPEMDYFTLKHNLLFRPLGIGTIVLKNKSGETITVRSVAYAPKAIKKMTEIKKQGREGKGRRKRDSWDE
jgi:hypothetical protein